MSAMSASSPPAGLMPLSLITEHKAPVQTPAVQPLARTPEKLAVQQPGPINKPPTLPNGMEQQISSNPVPVAPQHHQELPHPIVALENMAPPIHYPNFPAVSKAEQPTDGPSNSSSNSSRGEESVAEAPAHQVSLQPSASVSANPAPMPQQQPQPQPACVPLELAEDQPVADEAEAQTARTAESSQPSGAQEGASANVEPPKEAPQPPQQEPSEPEVKPTPAEPEKIEPPALPQKRSPSPPAAEVAPTPEPKSEPAEKEAPSVQAQSPEPTQTSSKATPRAKRPKATATKAEKKVVKETTPVDDDKKPKRKRLPTQIYQSPIPELNLIAKISKIEKKPQKERQDEKLIVFYRNEFLAVRNAEGGFYICQAMQNIYKSSSKIKIRWLSQENNGELYTPDFYDFTDFDCILTNLSLKRVGKDKFNLPTKESLRTQSILKRAIDVENGVAAPEDTVTEEHPDGLDLSLYRNEDQIKKKKGGKSNDENSDEEDEEGAPNKPIRPKRKLKKKKGKAKKTVVKEEVASTSTKRKAPEPQEPVSKAKITKKAQAVEKKEATPPAKKETKVLKRKAVSPAASSIPEKKGKKDTNVKIKSVASTAGTAKGSATTRRNLRTAK